MKNYIEDLDEDDAELLDILNAAQLLWFCTVHSTYLIPRIGVNLPLAYELSISNTRSFVPTHTCMK